MNADTAEDQRDTSKGGEDSQVRDARHRVVLDELLQRLNSRKWHVCVSPADYRSHHGHERQRIGAGSDDEILRCVPLESAIGHLLIRDIDLRFTHAREPAHLHISDDSDDFTIGAGEMKTPPDWILTGKEPLRGSIA